MGAAGGLASGTSLASIGFSAASAGLKAEGTATADQYQAEQLQQAAEYGELKATQTNAQSVRNLTNSLANIDAVRAASRTDPSSPTGAAVRGYTEAIGTEQKNITVDSITEQAAMDESNAAYLRQASSTALLGGDLGPCVVAQRIAGIDRPLHDLDRAALTLLPIGKFGFGFCETFQPGFVGLKLFGKLYFGQVEFGIAIAPAGQSGPHRRRRALRSTIPQPGAPALRWRWQSGIEFD
jgi:hypothetical protein